ncbi:RNA polymerase sigma factor [Flavobacterium hibernum]|uniref:LuxR family transcriptional regulator n=1 Tax=Flavobacterium hibernum TaxID=37752 RepID=A0A0D0END3_9FLAO|nr:RNA polymerase sigma-70 factor [Flavobacterium hibernum]KIO54490.1 LuxR family transcriptional regulator [Flavobacterium hibernum]OXA84511.1 RNA polymerase sigma-70 factor [Flavobacterium hibernum]STO10230.1 Probable RNA polymerase sigma factor fecI [Flavobacterium hibernum]
MKSEDYNDNDILIESLKNGDEKAYNYLIDTYHHKLCVYANSLVKNIYSAEDIVQNVFIKVWEQRTRLKTNHAIKSFLYKLVYNEFIDLYRKNQSLFSLEKSYYDALNSIVLEDDSESLQRVINVVDKEIQNLPPKCKEVFILSKKEGLTNIEIAEHLDVSIKTVEAQITKAFSILRSSLDDKIKNFLFLLFSKKKSLRLNL